MELISLERTDEVRYYLYDGHGNVRHLTDNNGAVTDTYDYDAFGNITEKTGETENSYLYCGEQFDANTGFYYLRARYMNPSTGTFISMDSYQGSIFDPVSLHKYLYANANPVMFTDPTGYFSLPEINVSQTINSILNSVTSPNFIGILRKLDTIATIYDTVVQIKDIMQSADGSAMDVAWALGTGLISGIFLNKMCSLKKIGPVVSKIVIAFGMVTELEGIFQAVEDGDWGAVASRTIHLLTSIVSLSQSCFTGETLVATEDGQVRIDEIELGDKVWAYNVETGETELKTVTKIYVHEVDEILHLYTSEGQIDTTTNHPFYVVDRGWVAAGDLKAGDQVLKLNGTVAVVTGSELEKLAESILVYNLEVEDFHTYYVGSEPVLVHNYEGDGKKPDVDEDGSGTKPDGAGSRDGIPDKGFDSFDDLKEYMGSPGSGNAWHHIVEQSQIGRSGFSSNQVNNVNNIVSVPHGKGTVHAQISGFYSSKPDFTNGMTVREWLSGKSFDEQFEFGLGILRKYGEVTKTSSGWQFTPF